MGVRFPRAANAFPVQGAVRQVVAAPPLAGEQIKKQEAREMEEVH